MIFNRAIRDAVVTYLVAVVLTVAIASALATFMVVLG